MKGKHSLWGKLLAVALLGALPVISCQSQPAAPPTSVPAAQATTATAGATVATSAAPAAPTAAPAAPTAAAGTVKIGVSVALTGPATRLGKNVANFTQMAIEDVNAKGIKVGGKVYRFDSVVVDNKNTSEAGIEAANRLVLAEKAKFIVGEFGTAWAGSTTVTTPNKVIDLCTGGPDALFGNKNPYSLSISSLPGSRISASYAWLVKTFPQNKRVAVVDASDALGQSTFDQAEKMAKTYGLTLVSKEAYPIDIKDFSPVATRVLQGKPDAIDLGAAGSRGPLFLAILKALKEQGYKGPTIAGSFTTDAVAANPDVMEGATQALLATIDTPLLPDIARDILSRYVKRWGAAELEPYIVIAYNAPWILAQAMEKAGTVDDTDKLIATLRAGEWDAVYGKGHFEGAQTFGMSAVLSMPVFLSGVRGGKVVVLDKVEVPLP